MSRELLASQKNNSGILLDPRTKLAVLITIAVFILGGSYEGIMQYYIIVLAAIPLLLLSAARKMCIRDSHYTAQVNHDMYAGGW